MFKVLNIAAFIQGSPEKRLLRELTTSNVQDNLTDVRRAVGAYLEVHTGKEAQAFKRLRAIAADNQVQDQALLVALGLPPAQLRNQEQSRPEGTLAELRRRFEADYERSQAILETARARKSTEFYTQADAEALLSACSANVEAAECVFTRSDYRLLAIRKQVMRMMLEVAQQPDIDGHTQFLTLAAQQFILLPTPRIDYLRHDIGPALQNMWRALPSADVDNVLAKAAAVLRDSASNLLEDADALIYGKAPESGPTSSQSVKAEISATEIQQPARRSLREAIDVLQADPKALITEDEHQAFITRLSECTGYLDGAPAPSDVVRFSQLIHDACERTLWA